MIRDILYFLGFALFLLGIYAGSVKFVTGQWLWQIYKQKKETEKRYEEEHMARVEKEDKLREDRHKKEYESLIKQRDCKVKHYKEERGR